MATQEKTRADREIDHGRYLAAGDPDALWGWDTPAGRRRADRRAAIIAAGAGLRPGVRALEIGCGTGLFSARFAATGADLTAVDISPDLLARARLRALDGSRVRFVEGRFENLRDDQPFDAVIGSSVLHHLELDDALENARRLLRPGGSFSFAEPNMLNPQVFLERRFSSLPLFSYVSPDETAFVRWTLKRALARHGYTDVRIEPFDWLHPSTPAPLIGLVGGLSRALELCPAVREFAGSLAITCRRP